MLSVSPCVRLRYAACITAAWLVVALALGIAGQLIGTHSIIPGPASQQALMENRGEERAKSANLPRRDQLVIVLGHKNVDVPNPQFARALESLHAMLSALKADDGSSLFRKIDTYGHTTLDNDVFVSEDRQHALVIAFANAPIFQSAAQFKSLPVNLLGWQEQFPGFELSYLSEGTFTNEMFGLIHRDLDRSLLYTVPLTMVVLLWVFRSVIAALIPLAVAVVSLIGSLGIASILSRIVEPISATATQLVVLLVLAIGVDYSLFIVSRLREEVRAGKSYEEAVQIASQSTGTAVFWSGITVALSLLGLFFLDDTVLTSMAIVSIAAVLFTMLGTIGALPSILLLLGPRIEWGRIIARPGSREPNFLRPWLSFSVAYPLQALLAAMVFIIPLVFAARQLTLGTTVEPVELPRSLQSRRAFHVLEEHFPAFAGIDFSVIAYRPGGIDAQEDPLVSEALDLLLGYETVRGPLKVEVSDDRSVARLHFNARGSGNDAANRQVIEDLRKLIAARMPGADTELFLGGTLPFVVDDVTRYRSGTPIAFGAVLLMSFMLLLMAFRSIVVPLKAIFLNLLSTAAAFGALALIFQDGPIPSWRYGVIESFVPPLLFAILFGLSMDYHVFMLGRIREEAFRGGCIQTAVQRAIAATAGTINGAAAIMVSVFLVISALELPMMKELGVGLAIAIVLDATIVRSVLLPASVVLLGSWNWYLPRWLQWVPSFGACGHSIEPAR